MGGYWVGSTCACYSRGHATSSRRACAEHALLQEYGGFWHWWGRAVHGVQGGELEAAGGEAAELHGPAVAKDKAVLAALLCLVVDNFLRVQRIQAELCWRGAASPIEEFSPAGLGEFVPIVVGVQALAADGLTMRAPHTLARLNQ